MKIIKAYGGLGNQMFQYAFYRYLSLNNSDVKFDIRDYNVHNYHQGFELKKVFNIDFEEPTKDEIKRLSVSQESLIVRFLFRVFGLRLCRTTEIFEQKDIMYISNEKTTEDMMLRGNWQNIGYIDPVERELRKRFVFPPLKGDNKKIADEIEKNNSISIHIRRGDYLKNTSLSCVCNDDYYDNAINFFLRKYGNCKFYFFSDDIEWCRERYSSLDAEYVIGNTGTDSFRDMQLMSLCKHNIIANSTFSWWGAWLNQHENKLVILPQRWETNRSSEKLQASGWIVI